MPCHMPCTRPAAHVTLHCPKPSEMERRRPPTIRACMGKAWPGSFAIHVDGQLHHSPAEVALARADLVDVATALPNDA